MPDRLANGIGRWRYPRVALIAGLGLLLGWAVHGLVVRIPVPGWVAGGDVGGFDTLLTVWVMGVFVLAAASDPVWSWMRGGAGK